MSTGTLVRVGAELLGLLVLCLMLRARGESLREVLALVPPRLSRLAVWVGAFIVLVAFEAVLKPLLGFPPVRPWSVSYDSAEVLWRLAGVVLVAPVAEELIFRGAAFTGLARTSLGASGAIAVTAAIFAMLHLQYGSGAMAFILVDALFYGLARAKTGTVLVPLVCHIIGNSYAAWERLVG
ncbi:MAG TPA: CPBP family intramembrane glutamic endopeptidase [Gemmatimonadales bacterium]|nr:CPBP family intramembrane glutamic endopeptidase [Gemmatimonadales bacterium]